ncbi:MAG: site-2 protease family protein [Gemmatimonadaceae bacterium]
MSPVLLFSMVAHEYAHGWAALKQGDPTAFQLGRLTWNPLKHIDPFFTVILPLITFFSGGFIFGGAKPVPVVARNYRNYRRGDIIVSLAGIVTNVILAICCIILFVVLGLLGRTAPGLNDSLALLQFMMRYGIIINLVLAMFNLLPIPPLDGSHVMKYLLPPAWSLRYQQLGVYGIFVLMILMATGYGQPIFSVWMAPVSLALGGIFGAVSPFGLTSQFLTGL